MSLYYSPLFAIKMQSVRHNESKLLLSVTALGFIDLSIVNVTGLYFMW